jgi:hypothetical protein
LIEDEDAKAGATGWTFEEGKKHTKATRPGWNEDNKSLEAYQGHTCGHSGLHRKTNWAEAELNRKGRNNMDYYIAAFVPEKEGNFSVYFPDIPNCVTGGYLVHAAQTCTG